MSEVKPIKVGLVGCGAWGWNYLHVLKGLHRFELVGVCDQDMDLLRRVKREYDVPGMSLTELCDKSDAIVIATPTATHVQTAVTAMGLGCHVLVEQPAARTVEEAKHLEDASTHYGKQIMAGHLMLHNAAFQEAMKHAMSGNWGDILLFQSIRWGTGRERE